MEYGKRSIRQIVSDMGKLSVHGLYFYKHKKPILVWYGNQKDIYSETSYSRWKRIDGKWVCRWIHCAIPEEYRIPEVEKYEFDGEYILPERVFNLILNCFDFDYGRSISDYYYMLSDIMSMSDM